MLVLGLIASPAKRAAVVCGGAPPSVRRTHVAVTSPLLQFLHPLLKALHGQGQRHVTAPMSVAEARQCGHSALVLSTCYLETVPDNVDDRAEWEDEETNRNIDHTGPHGR